jgi:hypothetical protein
VVTPWKAQAGFFGKGYSQRKLIAVAFSEKSPKSRQKQGEKPLAMLPLRLVVEPRERLESAKP